MPISSLLKKSGAVQAGSSLVITFDNDTTAASAIIVVWGSFFGGVTVTATDNYSNSYGSVLNDNSGAGTRGVLIGHNIAAGTGHQVTLSFGAGNYIVARLVEVAGLATSSAFDQTSGANATSTPFSSGSVTTTQADEYLLGFTHIQNTTTTWDSSAPWSAIGRSDDGTFHSITLQERVVSATGSYDSAWTTLSGGTPDSSIVTFKGASAGTPAPTLRFRRQMQGYTQRYYRAPRSRIYVPRPAELLRVA